MNGKKPTVKNHPCFIQPLYNIYAIASITGHSGTDIHFQQKHINYFTNSFTNDFTYFTAWERYIRQIINN